MNTAARSSEEYKKTSLVIAESGNIYYPTKGDSKNLKAKWVTALFKVMTANMKWAERSKNSLNGRGAKDKSGSRTINKIVLWISYLLFFIGITAAAFISKSAFLVLLNAYSQDYPDASCPLTTDENDVHHPYYLRFTVMLVLLLCLILPDGITFFYGFWRFLQMRKGIWPDGTTSRKFFLGLVLEISHAIGITFLTFSVWPYVDATLAISTFSLVAFIPAFASAIINMLEPKRKVNVIATVGMIALAIQFAVMSWLIFEQTQTTGEGKWKGTRTLIFVVAMLFVSVRCLDNSLNGVVKQGSQGNQANVEQDQKSTDGDDTSSSDLDNSKQKIEILESDRRVIWSTAYSLVRIVLITGLSFLIHMVMEKNKLDNLGQDVSKQCQSVVSSFRDAGLIQAFVAFGIFLLGASACKARMQKGIFCIALPLSMILMTVLTYFCAKGQSVIAESSTGSCNILIGSNDYVSWRRVEGDYEDVKSIFALVSGVLGSVSIALITYYNWFDPTKSLMSIDDLFVKPIFSGPLISEEMMLSKTESNENLNKAKDTKNENLNKAKDTKKDGDAKSTNTSSSSDEKQVYLCITMWQEQRKEMMQIIRSVLRLDKENAKSKSMKFEVHVVFDGAITKNKKFKEGKKNTVKKFCVNEFVEDLMGILLQETSAASMPSKKSDMNGKNKGMDKNKKTGKQEKNKEMRPVRFETPYGGKIAFKLPYSRSTMVIHLKDNNLIRNKKRWSQCMYLNYILRFLHKEEKGAFLLENTYILALDGDVDFKPESLVTLIEAIKRDHYDERIAAACGRVHPLGKGPVAWFQIFEYAVGHWLQKTTEEVLGCVLCSPGCFTLFRGSVLYRTGVIEEYMGKSKTATHKVQWDQGEDRWLCTLLLKAGKRIEYVSTSDSKTFAPTRFGEFFNQRRRWAPSTLANTMDILLHRAKFREKNHQLTRLYMVYQFLLNLASVLGLSTVILIIEGALEYVFGVPAIWSLVLSLAPVVFFVVICYTTSPDFQISVARILTLIYALVMAGILVTVIYQLVNRFAKPNEVGQTDGPWIFTVSMASLFVLIGLLHPTEIGCLIYGITYYLFVPSAFIFLPIYSYCNMHIVKWGTREAKEDEENEKGDRKDDDLVGLSCGLGTLCKCTLCLKKKKTVDKIDESQSVDLRRSRKTHTERLMEHFIKTLAIKKNIKNPMGKFMGKKRECAAEDTGKEKVEVYFDGPRGCRQNRKIHDSEFKFWTQLIASDLYPESDTDKRIAARDLKPELENLKNRMSGTYLFLNALWLALTFSLAQLLRSTPDLTSASNKLNINPLAFLFLVLYAFILSVQFCAMLFHRWKMYLLTLANGHSGSKNKEDIDIHAKDNPTNGLQENEGDLGGQRETAV